MKYINKQHDNINLKPLMLHNGNDLRIPCNQGREILTFQIIINEKLLKLAISYTDKPVKLANLAPIAQSLSDILFESFISDLDGTFKITCSKGCPYCCSYYVPISSAEAFYINDEISKIPPQKRDILLKSTLSAAKYIMENKLPANDNIKTTKAYDLNDISDWYIKLKLKCPFIMNNSCSIYKHRPLACREYFVEGPAFACRPDSALEPQMIELPFSIHKILSTISLELTGKNASSTILPLAIPWSDANPEIRDKTWPADFMANLFVSTLEKQTNQQLSPVYCIIE